jgi:hypothetical protein
MTTIEECPICFDTIGEINNITTECRHNFHASCLMTNITRNGFSCPCCRALMATHSEDDSDDDDDSDDSDDEHDDNDDDSFNYNDEEDQEDYILRGLRFFTNLLEGNDNYESDILYESELQNECASQLPSLEIIAHELKEKGITYEQLVANLLTEYEEYEENETIQRISDNLWGKIRTIISNYVPEERSSLNDID